jgi:hypothetical protein
MNQTLFTEARSPAPTSRRWLESNVYPSWVKSSHPIVTQVRALVASSMHFSIHPIVKFSSRYIIPCRCNVWSGAWALTAAYIHFTAMVEGFDVLVDMLHQKKGTRPACYWEYGLRAMAWSGLIFSTQPWRLTITTSTDSFRKASKERWRWHAFSSY